MYSPVYVLGTNIRSHLASACLLRNGEVLVAISKERLSRIKYDGGDEAEPVRYCLETAGIGIEDLDLVVQNTYLSHPPQTREQILFNRKLPLPDAPYLFSLGDGESPRVVTISHHLAHAYSTFPVSPFEESAIFIADGVGNYAMDMQETKMQMPANAFAREAESYYVGRGKHIKLVEKRWAPWTPNLNYSHFLSVGAMYSAAATYIFGDWQECGKVMGLSAFGDRCSWAPIVYGGGPDIEIRVEWLSELLKTFPKDQVSMQSSEFDQLAAVARRVQDELEQALIRCINWLYDKTKLRNLCLAGGVALNCVANRRILDDGPFEQVFIQPAAGDDGIALGCAMFGWLEVLDQPRRFQMRHTFFGKEYPNREVYQHLANESRIVFEQRKCDEVALEAAERIAQGKIVGWFQGGSEFGPRALGHRSILCDPRNPDLVRHLNIAVKHREPFRPYAPSVLREKCSEFFDLDIESPFMLLIGRVHPDKADIIPGVVHIDGTTRIQTLTQEIDGRFYDLVNHFYSITGVPLILNTSLNRAGEPIVETPLEALDVFLSTGIDTLIIGNYVINRRILDDKELLSAIPKVRSHVRIAISWITEAEGMSQPPVILATDLIARYVKERTFILSSEEFELVRHCNGCDTIRQLHQSTFRHSSVLHEQIHLQSILSLYRSLWERGVVDLR